MKNVVIIRDRGQLTIPDAIRKSVSWATPFSAVSITVTKPEEIVIRPHQVKVDKKEIWALVNKSRSNKGRGKRSAITSLDHDRANH